MSDSERSIRILGPIEIDGRDQAEPFGPAMRRLLGCIAVAGSEFISESALIDALWGAASQSPSQPTRTLQTYVSRLRSHLGADSLERTGAGYRLSPGAVRIDAAAFEARAGEGTGSIETDPHRAVAMFDQALAMWAGDAVAEFASEPWAMAEARRLEDLRLCAREQRAELLISLDRVDSALVSELGAMATDHEVRETPTRLHMAALHRLGHQADALAAYESFRRRLATDLGLEPSDSLRQLENEILTHHPGGTARSAGGERKVKDYELHERLGEGAFSIVYRGVQVSVGREVAIKQIRSELANRPEFIRRFEAEAHLVARLEHPRIVPLYDFWREPDSAYLVMRLLSSGSLETALRDGPLTLERTLDVVAQIGEALMVAHRARIVHRDVKPANILLDTDGNAYLTDFGIALASCEDQEPEASLSAGSPAYASPEQLRREPVGPTADVHGLAIATYEMLSGQLPFPNEPSHAALLQRQLHDPVPALRATRSDIPAAVDDVIARATAKRPGDRYQSVAEMVDEFRVAVDGPAEVASPRSFAAATFVSDARNPYKGLRAFDEADAADFAGRARLVDQLSATVASHRFVAVVGPSGSGKSSVVRAGLMPAVRAGAIEGSKAWYVSSMVPGAHPFEALETALLRVAAERPPDLLGVLADGPRGIARAVRHVVPDDSTQILIVIDQFEELFTLASSDVARRFLDALAVAVSEERPHLRVVVTLRADFYDRPLQHELVGRLVRDATVAVLPLAADELERAIIDPAQAVGANFEPGLVSEIVADVADKPGALPMLQYVLTELYERRMSGLMLRSDYHDLGGVSGVLARRAEELCLAAPEADEHAIRRIFGRLVRLGEGTEDTRRRALRREVAVDPESEAALESFGAARLLNFDVDLATRTPTVELAHEALLREWPRLRGWLDEDREGLRILRHIGAASEAWRASNREPSELYRGGRLEAAVAFASDRPDALLPDERRFVEASEALAEDEAAADRLQVLRLRRLLATVAVVAAFAVVAGVLALGAQRQADAQRAEAETASGLADTRRVEAEAATALATGTAFRAETARIVATAESLADTNPRVAMLLAAAAYDREQSPVTLGGLQVALTSAGPLVGHLRWGVPYTGAVALNGDRLAGIHSGGVEVFAASTGEVVAEASFAVASPVTLHGARDAGLVSASADGLVLAVATSAPSVRIFNTTDGLQLVGELEVDRPVVSISVDPGGERIVVADSGAVVTGWRSDGALLFSVDVNDAPNVYDQALPYLGEDMRGASVFADISVETVVTAGDSEIVVAVGALVHRLSYDGDLSAGRVHTFDPGDGNLIAALARGAVQGSPATVLGLYSLVDVSFTDTEIVVAEQLEGFAVARPPVVAAAKLGDSVLVVALDGVLRQYPSSSAEANRTIDLDLRTANGLAIVEGNVFIAHARGLTRVTLDARGPLSQALPRRPDSVLSVSPDGGLVAIAPDGNVPGDLELWRQIDGGFVRVDHGLGRVDWAAITSDEFVIETRPETVDGEQVELAFTLPDLAQIKSWPLPPAGLSSDLDIGLDLSVIGQQIQPNVWITRMSDGVLVASFSLDGADEITTARFDPASERLLVASGVGVAALYGVDEFRRLETPSLTDMDIAVGHWNHDGSLVATASSQGRISIRDGETFELIRTMVGTTGTGNAFAAGALFFSADDTTLLTNFDGTGRLWDVASGQQIGQAFPSEPGAYIGANQGDGLHLVTGLGPSALVWDLDMDTWRATACTAAGSNLTEDEWAQWGPRDQGRSAVCGQHPLS